MKQQFVKTHRYTVLQETEEKSVQTLNKTTSKHVRFCTKT